MQFTSKIEDKNNANLLLVPFPSTEAVETSGSKHNRTNEKNWVRQTLSCFLN